MSKKGAYIYQQIAQTTAEWANDTNIYPANVLLYEILEDGRVKMRMSDGVHTFSELPGIMANCQVSVLKDNPNEYVVNFTTPWESVNTPNLRARNGQRVVTIDHVPGPTDLTYEQDGFVYNWSIGDVARYYDPEDGKYIFYRLNDIDQTNMAVWFGDGSFGADLDGGKPNTLYAPDQYINFGKVTDL